MQNTPSGHALPMEKGPATRPDYATPGIIGFFWPLTLWPMVGWLACVALARRTGARRAAEELEAAERRARLAVFEREMGLAPKE